MKITDTLDVRTRAAWRRWLEKNHTVCKEIWLIYHKKSSGVARVAYDDAVEEALCAVRPRESSSLSPSSLAPSVREPG